MTNFSDFFSVVLLQYFFRLMTITISCLQKAMLRSVVKTIVVFLIEQNLISELQLRELKNIGAKKCLDCMAIAKNPGLNFMILFLKSLCVY